MSTDMAQKQLLGLYIVGSQWEVFDTKPLEAKRRNCKSLWNVFFDLFLLL